MKNRCAYTLSKAKGDHLQYKYLRNQTNLIRLTKKKYYGQVVRNAKGSSKQMWKQIREISGKEFKGLNINNITKDGVHYNDVSEIVNLLNDYFSNAANRVLCNLPNTDFNVSLILVNLLKTTMSFLVNFEFPLLPIQK